MKLIRNKIRSLKSSSISNIYYRERERERQTEREPEKNIFNPKLTGESILTLINPIFLSGNQ